MTTRDTKRIQELAKEIKAMKEEINILKQNSHPAKEFICLECGCKAKRKEK